MGARKLVLYNYWRSSSSYRVRLALAHKQLSYDYAPVSLIEGEQAKAAYLARNPNGYVPCLTIDGEPYAESVAILELLDDLYPELPLYPRDPRLRARARMMIEVINAGIQPLQNLNVLRRHSQDGAAQRAWAAHYNDRGLRVIEAMIAEDEARGLRGKFAFGESFGAVDCFLLPQTYSARRFGVDVDAFPRVAAAEKSGLATEAARLALPENQPDAPPPAK